MECLHCKTITNNPKFCSKSCSASYNNKGVRRHGRDPKSKITNHCKSCGVLTANPLFCSKTCSLSSRNKGDEHRKKMSALRQSKYRAKKLRVVDPTANKEKIKKIYLDCPEGYEVDHIVPLSKGGKHHEDNLQYLTIKDNRSKNNRLVGREGLAPPI
jgi:5-methylcytosine-specific restriction endonuclease McrA